MASQTIDLGSVLSLVGVTTLSTNYAAGTTMLPTTTYPARGSADQIGLLVAVAFDATPGATSITLTVEGRRSSGSWFALQTQKSSTGVVDATHAWLQADGVAQGDLITVFNTWMVDEIRVKGKCAGTSKATDTVTVYARKGL